MEIPKELLPYLTGQKKDDSSLQDSILRISITFAVLVTVSTVLRLGVRARLVGNVGLDDILMIFAFLFALLLSASCLTARHFGLGLHLWNLTPNIYQLPEYTARATKALYGCYLSYALAIAFVKFSIIATYFRIFTDKKLRRICSGIAFIVAASLVCNIFAIIFTCVPVQAAWKYDIKGKCFPIVNFFYASSGINIATDLALCLLPIPTLWALKMPKPNRVILCILFALGLFTCIASILRLSTLHYAAGSRSIDFSYNTVITMNWCVIEVGTAVTCASLSSLRPLLSKFAPRLFAHLSTNASSSKRASVPPTRGRSVKLSKLSNISHTHSRSASVAWNHGDNERGEIVVQQTFDMMEEWDVVREKDGQSTWGKVKSETLAKKMESKTRECADDSEEELVKQRT